MFDQFKLIYFFCTFSCLVSPCHSLFNPLGMFDLLPFFFFLFKFGLVLFEVLLADRSVPCSWYTLHSSPHVLLSLCVCVRVHARVCSVMGGSFGGSLLPFFGFLSPGKPQSCPPPTFLPKCLLCVVCDIAFLLVWLVKFLQFYILKGLTPW